MAEDNPFAKYAGHPAANPFAGYVPVGDPDPTYATRGPMARAQLQREQAVAAQAAQQAAAETRIKNAQAEEQERKNADQRAADRVTTMRRTSNLSGPQYLATLPADRRAIVSGLLQGNLPVGARGLTSPQMIPYIQDAMNVDPSFSANTFAARQKAVTELASAKATGGYLATTAAAIDHSREMEDAIVGLHNPSGWLASHGGAYLNYKLLNEGRPADTTFAQANRVFAGEQTKGIVGNIGTSGQTAVSDRKEGEDAMNPRMAQDSLFAGMRTGAQQLYQKLRTADQLYNRTMGGAHIPEIVTPEQAKQLVHLMRLRDDGTEGPIPNGLDPSFLKIAGISANGGGGGGGAPGAGPGGSIAGPSSGSGSLLTPNGPIAAGSTKASYDPKMSALVDTLIRKGATAAEINAALVPLGGGTVDQQSVTRSQQYLKANPGYKGSLGYAAHPEPTTGWNRFAGSPVGTGIYAGLDAAAGGTTDEITSLLGGGNLGDLNARKQAAFSAHPTSAFLGQTVGTIGSMVGLGAAGKALGISGIYPQLAGDFAFGAGTGAGQSNDNRVSGAVVGGVGGLAGDLAGLAASPIIGAIGRTAPGIAIRNAGVDLSNSVGRRFGLFGGMQRILPAAPLSASEQATSKAITAAGPNSVTSALTEAQGLNLPMSLADTSSNLRELAGAAVRRSPSASTFAESNLLPRNYGQFDRFTSAVDQNIGPTANLPRRSADLAAQARADAAPLYERAYSQPVVSTPELDATLKTPFGQQAVARARAIAANERRNPTELGFGQDASGNILLNPQPYQGIASHLDARAELDAAQDAYRAARADPKADLGRARTRLEAARQGVRDADASLAQTPDPSQAASMPGYTTQTLDYVKRGMDDVLEQQRNPITGRLQLDEAGRAQNTLKNQFLAEVDRINPDYAAARGAYAGPASSRSAMDAGYDAYGVDPNQLGVDIAGASPERLGQMRLGYQSALVDHASRIRDTSNPWEATFGSPVARDRFSTMFPNNPGVPNLFRQRELEGNLQQTTNAILGNSRTARNQIADQAFATNPAVEAGAHAAAALATHGVSMPITASRYAGSGVLDALKTRLNAGAVAKADDIAPMLMTPDPSAGLATVRDLLDRDQAYQAFVAASRPKRIGMFGAGFGSQAAVAPLNY